MVTLANKCEEGRWSNLFLGLEETNLTVALLCQHHTSPLNPKCQSQSGMLWIDTKFKAIRIGIECFFFNVGDFRPLAAILTTLKIGGRYYCLGRRLVMLIAIIYQ